MFNYNADVKHTEHRKESLLRQAKLQALARESADVHMTMGERWSRLIGDILGGKQDTETEPETE
jgi:hypothetical protein